MAAAASDLDTLAAERDDAGLAGLGLRYVTDEEPGISRRRSGKGFVYRDPEGKLIKDADTLRWIRSLAVPPAWKDVWISPWRNGHLLATGRDDKGRKQYRYHGAWRGQREAAKFDHMLEFGRALPRIRGAVEAEIARPGLGRRKVLAVVVRLLEMTLIRVGNDEYARANRTYGLTTLRDQHFRTEGQRLRFSFKGKHGKRHVVAFKHRRLAALVKKMQDLPGQELFQYVDADGNAQPIGSGDVNAFLREIGEGDFTAKDFRTWSATVLAAWALREFEAVDSQAAAKRNVTQAIERVATRLGNTPAICRKSYVHPEIVGAYLDGSLAAQLKAEIEEELRDELDGLEPEEAAVLVFLRQRLASASAEPGKAAA